MHDRSARELRITGVDEDTGEITVTQDFGARYVKEPLITAADDINAEHDTLVRLSVEMASAVNDPEPNRLQFGLPRESQPVRGSAAHAAPRRDPSVSTLKGAVGLAVGL